MLTNELDVARIAVVRSSVRRSERRNPMKLVYTLVNKDGQEIHPDPKEVGSEEKARELYKELLEEAKKNGDTIKSATTVG